MEQKKAETELEAHGIRPTAVRIVVWNAVNGRNDPFTLKDVEEWLPYMDRSSIFRALRLFASQHLLHEIDDGTGLCKYCLCRCDDTEHHLGHVHFTCTECGRTYCITDVVIPQVELPDGFEMHEAGYVIKGRCNRCGTRALLNGGMARHEIT